MIPSSAQIKKLWKVHALPHNKQIHCTLVMRVAVWFAHRLMDVCSDIHINIALLSAAALLHDIDKMARKEQGEHHPDTGVRILNDAGFFEVADLVRTHPLHSILDQTISPKTWEEKILYLADKMTKYTVITVDKRFALWREESLPLKAVRILDATYPKVKALEESICSLIHVDPKDIALLVKEAETSTILKDD